MSEDEGSKLTAIELRRLMLGNGGLRTDFLKNVLSPELGEAIRAFRDSPAMTLMRNFNESPTGKMLQQMHQAFGAYHSALLTIPKLVFPPEIINAGLVAREFGQALERMHSPLADYLASGRAPDFGALVEASGVASASAFATAEPKVVKGKELEVDRQIVAHLEGGNAVGTLSTQQQARLWSVMQLLQMILIWLATQNGVREELCLFQPKLVPALSASQTGKAVRNFMCERDAPLEILRSYRTVKGTEVRLRVDPSMKAAQVQVTLEDRALLEVLDSSNRDWLLVSVINEDGVEGWISRKYTYRLLR